MEGWLATSQHSFFCLSLAILLALLSWQGIGAPRVPIQSWHPGLSPRSALWQTTSECLLPWNLDKLSSQLRLDSTFYYHAIKSIRLSFIQIQAPLVSRKFWEVCNSYKEGHLTFKVTVLMTHSSIYRNSYQTYYIFHVVCCVTWSILWSIHTAQRSCIGFHWTVLLMVLLSSNARKLSLIASCVREILLTWG